MSYNYIAATNSRACNLRRDQGEAARVVNNQSPACALARSLARASAGAIKQSRNLYNIGSWNSAVVKSSPAGRNVHKTEPYILLAPSLYVTLDSAGATTTTGAFPREQIVSSYWRNSANWLSLALSRSIANFSPRRPLILSVARARPSLAFPERAKLFFFFPLLSARRRQPHHRWEYNSLITKRDCRWDGLNYRWFLAVIPRCGYISDSGFPTPARGIEAKKSKNEVSERARNSSSVTSLRRPFSRNKVLNVLWHRGSK